MSLQSSFCKDANFTKNRIQLSKLRYICLQDCSYLYYGKFSCNNSGKNPCCLMEGNRKILNQSVSLTKTPYKPAMLCQGGRKRGRAPKEGIWGAHVMTLFSFWKNLCLLLYAEKMSGGFFVYLLACIFSKFSTFLNILLQEHFIPFFYTAPLT